MKKTIFLAAMLLAAASAQAWNCPDGKTKVEDHPGKDCNVPIPPKNPPATVPPTSSSKSGAQSSSGSAAGAIGVGTGGQGGSADARAAGGNAATDISGVGNSSESNSYRAIAVQFPNTVAIPASANTTCPDTGATNIYFGWGLWNSTVKPPQTGCESRQERKYNRDTCQYDTERLLKLKYLKDMGVTDVPQLKMHEGMPTMDLSADECDVHHEQLARANQPVTNNYITNNYGGPDYHIIDSHREIPPATPEQKVKACVPETKATKALHGARGKGSKGGKGRKCVDDTAPQPPKHLTAK